MGRPWQRCGPQGLRPAPETAVYRCCCCCCCRPVNTIILHWIRLPILSAMPRYAVLHASVIILQHLAAGMNLGASGIYQVPIVTSLGEEVCGEVFWWGNRWGKFIITCSLWTNRHVNIGDKVFVKSCEKYYLHLADFILVFLFLMTDLNYAVVLLNMRANFLLKITSSHQSSTQSRLFYKFQQMFCFHDCEKKCKKNNFQNLFYLSWLKKLKLSKKL